MQKLEIIPPRSGVAFLFKKGDRLKVVDLQGEQVSDMICYSLHDNAEYLSSGRTIDYAESIFLTQGHKFYSNRSNVMFEMVEDTVGRHDFLLSPCSAEMFRITYGHNHPHQGCYGNLCEALEEFDILPDNIPTTFNIFMNVSVDGANGKITVLPPKSKAGDHVIFEAKMDLIVGLTSCSAGMSNNYKFKEIGWHIITQVQNSISIDKGKF